MGKNKLRRFNENLTFECLIQSNFNDVFGAEHPMKGHWGRDFFGNDNPIVLEIGCGRGEYTLALARGDKHKNFIGIDIKGARLWRGAKTATEEKLSNAGFLRTRVEVLDSFFAPGEVSEVWITFPDPQLKKSRKRLTSAMFLNRYSAFLAPEAKIHLKTDSLHLHEYTKALLDHNSIKVDVCEGDIYGVCSCELSSDVTSTQTTYESRFIKEGLSITYLRFSMPVGYRLEEVDFYGDRMSGDLDRTRIRRTTTYDLPQAAHDKGVHVEIDAHSGFCFGVVRAISSAEESLLGRQTVYCLGEIVHNSVEVERLEKMGLKVISHHDLSSLPSGSKVLIRAHGEPPTTYTQIEKNALTLIDATCPVVASLQKRVRLAWDKMQKVNGTVVILGKKGHSEVVGLTGGVNEDAIVVESLDDLDLVDFSRPITLLSQTTQSLDLFDAIQNEIRKRTSQGVQVEIHDTICRQVSNRAPGLSLFASNFDVVVFVSGRHSSNGAVLFEACRRANPRSHLIERQDEVERSWFDGVQRVGICGATSTPLWLMELVAEKIIKIVR